MSELQITKIAERTNYGRLSEVGTDVGEQDARVESCSYIGAEDDPLFLNNSLIYIMYMFLRLPMQKVWP